MVTLRLPLVPRSIRWGLVVLVAAALAIFSVIRPSGTGVVLGPLGLVGLGAWTHAIGYGGLALVLGYAMVDAPVERTLFVVFLAAVGYGLLIEVVQLGLAYRTFDPADIVANGIGAALAAGVWRLLLASSRVRVDGVDGEPAPQANPDAGSVPEEP